MSDAFSALPLPRQPSDPDELPFAYPLSEREQSLSRQLEQAQLFLDNYAGLPLAAQAQLRYRAEEVRARKQRLEQMREWRA